MIPPPIHCDSCGRFIYDGYDRFYVADEAGQPVVIGGRDFVVCARQKCQRWRPTDQPAPPTAR